jgi:hypothetical protein
LVRRMRGMRRSSALKRLLWEFKAMAIHKLWRI